MLVSDFNAVVKPWLVNIFICVVLYFALAQESIITLQNFKPTLVFLFAINCIASGIFISYLARKKRNFLSYLMAGFVLVLFLFSAGRNLWGLIDTPVWIKNERLGCSATASGSRKSFVRRYSLNFIGKNYALTEEAFDKISREFSLSTDSLTTARCEDNLDFLYYKSLNLVVDARYSQK